jgi:hypothetical protein
MICHIERIYGHIVFAKDKCDDHCDDPNYPDHIFYSITFTLLYRRIFYQESTFLQTSGRAQISTPRSPKEQGKYQHRKKYDEAAIYDVL